MSAQPYDPGTFEEDHVFEAPGLLGWLTRRRKAAVLEFVRAGLKHLPRSCVLDVGCGYGDMLADTTAAVRVGVDLNTGALAQAAVRAPGARFVVSAVEQLPFAAGSFDGVICSEVLEHLKNPEELAGELMRVTRPGGICCITVPNETITTVGRYLLGKRPAKSPAHKQAFTPHTVAALFTTPPVRRRLVPFAPLPFAVATNVVMLFRKADA